MLLCSRCKHPLPPAVQTTTVAVICPHCRRSVIPCVAESRSGILKRGADNTASSIPVADLAEDNSATAAAPPVSPLRFAEYLLSAATSIRQRMRRNIFTPVSLIAIIATIGILTVLLVVLVVNRQGNPAVPTLPSLPSEFPALPRLPSLESGTPMSTPILAPLSGSDLAVIVERVEPAVVRINARQSNGQSSVGSGVIISSNGTIATNLHVVRDASDIEVIFHDGSRAPVKEFLHVHPHKDLILLRCTLPSGRLSIPPLSSRLPRKGDPVFTIGAPQGYDFSVSEGIVSAVRAPGAFADSVWHGQATQIQITAAISPGNSGGPLFNLKGEVIGINTWKRVDVGSESLNFAVSAIDLIELQRSSPTTATALADLPQDDDTSAIPDFENISGTSIAQQLLRTLKSTAVLTLVTHDGEKVAFPALDVLGSAAETTLRESGYTIISSRSQSPPDAFVLIITELQTTGDQVLANNFICVVVVRDGQRQVIWQEQDSLRFESIDDPSMAEDCQLSTQNLIHNLVSAAKN